jgi:arylsulfatase A-like enzyme
MVSLAIARIGGSVERPNFIVIMVDDMGYAGVSCFGNPYFQTPNIDRLAKEGMRWTDFHTSGTVCSPTRAGLLTGRYQQRAGIEAVIHPATDHPEHRKGLQLIEATFAEQLREAGYATGGLAGLSSAKPWLRYLRRLPQREHRLRQPCR